MSISHKTKLQQIPSQRAMICKRMLLQAERTCCIQAYRATFSAMVPQYERPCNKKNKKQRM